MKVERYVHQLQRRCGKCGRTTVGKHYLINGKALSAAAAIARSSEQRSNSQKANFFKAVRGAACRQSLRCRPADSLRERIKPPVRSASLVERRGFEPAVLFGLYPFEKEKDVWPLFLAKICRQIARRAIP
jgi:hypothetical protein